MNKSLLKALERTSKKLDKAPIPKANRFIQKGNAVYKTDKKGHLEYKTVYYDMGVACYKKIRGKWVPLIYVSI